MENKKQDENTFLIYKGYKGTIEYSTYDKLYFGEVLGMGKSLLSYHGENLAELEEDFREAIEDYFALCMEENIPIKKPI